MKANYQNILTSSFLLYIDHEITKRGEAYTNLGSLFYPITGVYKNYYTYAAPYKQLISDYSLSGPTRCSGVYLDGSFITPGQSGLLAINHYDGQLIFSSNKNSYSISGNYAIKDYNVYLTDKSEDKILFYTKIENKNRRPQTIRALQTNEVTYPAIFLTMISSKNDPFAFGGVDMTNTYFRAIVMSDSQFSLDAACGILRDSSHNFFRLVDNNDLKLNAMSSYTGTPYNYTGIATGAPVYIADVNVSRVSVSNSPDFVDLNPDVFSAFVDFDLESVRNPHAGTIPV
jgi:hypothetical protein